MIFDYIAIILVGFALGWVTAYRVFNKMASENMRLMQQIIKKYKEHFKESYY